MKPAKVYFGFYDQGYRIGFFYIAENLDGSPIGSRTDIANSIKGIVARSLAILIAKNRKKKLPI